MIRFLHAGASATLLSTLCAACPHGAYGCCVVPPRLALADIGRIVLRGGRDFLLAELAAGRIVAHAEWMILARTHACVYLGESGCTIPHDVRPATCNFYVCESALDVAGETAARARSVRDDLERTYARWDAELAALLRARAPGGVVLDADALTFLGVEYARLSSARHALTSGRPAYPSSPA